MTLLEILLLGIGLSMDAFAVSVCKGLALGRITWRHMAIAGTWFGTFQALMPTLGYTMGTFFSSYVVQYNYWIACILLVAIGANMIRESSNIETANTSMGVMTMFLLAIATSIDALAVGVTFSFMNVPVVLAVCLIGCTTFILSAIGVKVGSLFGTKYKTRAEQVGGIALILIGMKILLEGLGVV